MRYFLTAILLFATHLSFASDLNNIFDSLGSLPSAIVNSSVNMINGAYIEQHEDITLPGAEGLTLSRSLSRDSEDIIPGWVTNHRHRISDVALGYFKQIVYATYEAPHGMMFWFEKYDDKSSVSRLKIPNARFQNGLTNTGRGMIGAKTNYRNVIMKQLGKGHIEIRDGSGERISFRAKEKIYYPKYIEHPNRLFTRYLYDDEGKLHRIYAENREGITLSSISFWDATKNKGSHKRVKKAKTHNGQEVSYNFDKTTIMGKSGFYEKTVLSSIENSHAPTISYVYELKDSKDTPRIQKRSTPDDRFLQTFYYDSKDSYSEGKVKEQRAPVGHDKRPIKTHTYQYLKGKDYHRESRVYDAYNSLKTYHHYKNKLYAIKHYMGSGQHEKPYLIEKFLWPNSGHPAEGNLAGHLICESDNNQLIYKRLLYDERGNVTEESLFGNLTGYSSAPLDVRGCEAERNGIEVFVKRFTYSNDIYNNMLSEEDGRKKIHHGYYPENDLIKEQFTYDGDRIAIRKFYFYDQNRVVDKTVIDNGSHPDFNNLTGVTERLITEYDNHKKDIAGLPSEIVKKYLDLDSGTEVILTKKKFTYTPEGWPTEIAEYDSQGALITQVQKKYNNCGDVILEINGEGYATERRYDANRNMIYEKGPRSDMHKEFGYDWSNRLVYQKEMYADGIQLQESYSYDYRNNKVSETDHFGNTVHYQYDTFGRVLEGTKRDGTIASRHSYNRLGHIISKTDGKGQEHRIETTCRGQPVHAYFPDGTTEHYRYSLDGLLVEETSREGITTRYELDFLGRVTGEIRYSQEGEYLDGRTYEYNAFHLVKETDPQGKVTHYRYDFAGRLVKIESGDRVKAIEYDDCGREVKVIQYASADDFIATQKTYDALNRVISEEITDSQGQLQSAVYTRYDCDGNKIAITEYGKAGTSTQIKEYNAHGEIIKEVDALGNTSYTRYRYDYINDQGHRVGYRETIDPRSNRTIVIKDRCGRDEVLMREDAFGVPLHKTTFSYDGNNNKVASVEDVHLNGKVIRRMINRWEYDSGNRITKKIEAEGTPQQKEISVTYNGWGQKTSMIKSDGVVVSYTYNNKGLLETICSSDGTIDYSYRYDAVENPIIVEDHVQGRATKRYYNQHGEVYHETLANGHSLACEFDGAGRCLSVGYPDGLRLHYTYQGKFLKKMTAADINGVEQFSHHYVEYDQRGKLLEAQCAGNAGPIHYDYDLLGRVRDIKTKHWRENIAGFDESGNLTQKEISDRYGITTCNYQYDAMNQLRKESGAANHEYQHDSLNNRTSKDGVAHEINNLNQILSDGFRQFYYDPNGNIIKISDSVEEIRLHWDAFDRLIKVEKNGAATHYTYDELHRRLTKDKESYLYHGKHEVGMVDASGHVQEKRFLGNGIAAEIGATVGMEIRGKFYAAINDHNGNIAVLIDAAANRVIESYRFSAFGEEITESKECINPWRFSGKRYDQETGFIYFGRRYYLPEIGRWLSADPLGDRDGVNLYAYVSNNPLTNTDAFGLCRNCELKSQSQQQYYFPTREEARPVSFSQLPHYGPSFDKANDKYLQYAQRNFKVLKMDRMGDKPGPLGTMQILATGINTTVDECIQATQKASEMSGGHYFYSICDPTNGVVPDVFNCAILKCHIDTQAVKELRGFLQYATNELKKECLDPKLYTHNHSRGGMQLDRAGRRMPKENRQHIEAHTYGSATIIPRGLFSYIMNNVNNLDLISRTDMHGLIFNSEVVKYTNWSTGSIFDVRGNHAIDSEGYLDAMEYEIRRYQQDEIWHR